MRFRTIRSIMVGVAVMLLCGLIAAFLQAAQSSDVKVRAREILDQTRTALGGDAALNAVRSLSASGDFRRGSGNIETSGDVQLDLLLPDKLMRTTKWSSPQEMKITNIEVMDGRKVWTDSQAKDLHQITSSGPIAGSGIGHGGSRGGGTGHGGSHPPTGGSGSSKGDDGIKGPVPKYADSMDSQQILPDFSCLIITMLLHLPDSTQVEIDSGQDGNIDGAKADFLKFTTSSGSAISLAIDQKTHRPIMATYDSWTAGPAEEKQTASSKSETTHIQIYLSDYRAITEKKVGDIWLPHQLTKTRNGLTVEDMRIKKFQLNPNIKAKQFEKQR